ncbi:MAG: hypothetical protein OQK04_02675 [Kangiellaceae bacterium]|nr:hypothetical protein [Kangiellaceae bacterium]MCW8997609.1 hypothetical protein [Kangiellaceae bacterium]
MNQTITNSNDQNQQTSSSKLIERILEADWKEYYQLLFELGVEYQVSNSLKLLNLADQLLNQNNVLGQLNEVQRYAVGGIADKQLIKQYPFDTKLLGDMQTYPSFKKFLKTSPKGLSKLLSVIPKSGPIDGWHYLQFIDTYQQVTFENGIKQPHLAPATRLLSMRRPDQFVCLSDSAMDSICEAFNIKAIKKNQFQRYWDEIIVPIQTTKWFKEFQPIDTTDLPFHRARAALLERIACGPLISDFAEEIPSSFSTITTNSSADSTPNNTGEEPKIEEKLESSTSSDQFIKAERTTKPKPSVKQPKKLTIQKRKSEKVNRNAATKLMSAYYFANKSTFSHLNMAQHREAIIDRLVEGESVEEVFNELRALN